MSNASNYLHAAKRYRVVAVVTIVRSRGKDVRLNRGALVPADVGSSVIDHLLGIGHIVEVQSSEEAT